jgi:hypothetical protein
MNSDSMEYECSLPKVRMTKQSPVVDSYLFKYWLLRFMDEREVEVTS